MIFQAPSGATSTEYTAPTELETFFWFGCYKDFAPTALPTQLKAKRGAD